MLSSGLPRLRIRQLARLMESGALTSEQLCSYCYTLALAGEEVWNLGAFSYLLPKEHVLEQARRSDERRKHTRDASLLEGIPVTIKANIAVDFLPLTAGSRILGAHDMKNMPFAGYNADVVESLLIQGGAVCLGSTTMDEFGMGSLGTNVMSHTGMTETKNPTSYIHRMGKRDMSDTELLSILSSESDAVLEAHALAMHTDDQTYSAGGSSCGSAASVAHGSSIASLGTDTGGSVRLPAAWCNVVGLKPTYGLLSRYGLVGYASSLDCPGILASSADCVGIVLDLLMGMNSGRDPTMDHSEGRKALAEILMRTSPLESKPDTATQPLRGITVGIPAAFSVSECPQTVLDTWETTADRLERLGATVKIVDNEALSTDIVQQALSAYYVLACAEASSNLARYDGVRYGVAAVEDVTSKDDLLSPLERQYARTRSVGFGTEVKRRVLSGTAVLSSDRFHTYYEAAARLRSTLTRELLGVLSTHDILLVPSALFPPVTLDGRIDPTEMLANDVMTVPISLAGLPAISVCPGQSSDRFRPSMQLIGSRLGEATLLQTAMALENKI